MINENHIIKFKYSFGLYNRLGINNDIYINEYKLSKKTPYFIDDSLIQYHIQILISIYYNNLNIHSLIPSNNYSYIFNLSNMLYKLHTKDYYSKTHQNKGLI